MVEVDGSWGCEKGSGDPCSLLRRLARSGGEHGVDGVEIF